MTFTEYLIETARHIHALGAYKVEVLTHPGIPGVEERHEVLNSNPGINPKAPYADFPRITVEDMARSMASKAFNAGICGRQAGEITVTWQPGTEPVKL